MQDFQESISLAGESAVALLVPWPSCRATQAHRQDAGTQTGRSSFLCALWLNCSGSMVEAGYASPAICAAECRLRTRKKRQLDTEEGPGSAGTRINACLLVFCEWCDHRFCVLLDDDYVVL